MHFDGTGGGWGMSTTTDPMPIKAIAPWFGSKRTLAPVIVEELGKHSAYWEPFCGSMAVLLAKPPSSMETVNDLYGDLVNLSRCVQHPTVGAALYRRLRRVLNCQAEFIAARSRALPRMADPVGDLDIDRAADYFIVSWQGMNGVAGTQSNNLGFARRFTKNGGHAAKRFMGCVDSIPAWRRRLRSVSVLNCCGIELCERIEDAPGVVIYCDPPYLVKGASYRHDFKDGFMGKTNDHERLAAALRRFKKTRVVVSYYAHPALAAMYPDWTVRDCTMTKSLVSSGKRDADNDIQAPEVLLINGPSLAGGRVI